VTEHKNFAVVDAAMNDMLRPSLYQAWMDVQNVGTHVNQQEKTYDVVGPVCESGDFLAKSRQLTVNEGDCLCLFSAGAYGFVMSSNYNSRPRVAEIMVNGDSAFVIRQRETLAELIKGEHLLPEQ
jgi:diaminopimelate decarboxylase